MQRCQDGAHAPKEAKGHFILLGGFRARRPTFCAPIAACGCDRPLGSLRRRAAGSPIPVGLGQNGQASSLAKSASSSKKSAPDASLFLKQPRIAVLS
jgi:hypothetical protein